MSETILTLIRAMDYAARQHTGQTRKGSRANPYIKHPVEVATMLAEATGGADVGLIVAGLLHDVVEDTDATIDDVERLFGRDIAGIVAEVTDDKSKPKEVRKSLQIETAAGKSARARMLKLTDKTCNLRDLVADPPHDWEADRRADYVDWAKQVAARCGGVNQALETAFEEASQAATAAFA